MKPIKSFEDAKRRLAEVKDTIIEVDAFLTSAGDTISKVIILKGTDYYPEPSQSALAPATWGERVIEIFRQADKKPLMQKDAAERYSKTGWPGPSDPAELYRAISGAIAYLHKKKGVLEKTDSGYRLKE